MLLLLCGLFVTAVLAGLVPEKRQASLASWIELQAQYSRAGVIANIGDGKGRGVGAANGVIIAGPSTYNPNYLYTWVRDSSLTEKLIVDEYLRGKDWGDVGGEIEAWITSQKTLQYITNPSGNITTGGLGEPKFNINETEFTDPWGRPQRDGPALRSTVMITYANYLMGRGGSSEVKSRIWPSVMLDLDYVVKYWNETGFDLWEEVDGSSFFTSAVQHRALVQGAALSGDMGDWTRASLYKSEASKVLCFMQNYWNSTGSQITSNINLNDSRSGLDANSLLGSIHTFDPKAGCDSATFQPCSDRALANHYAVVNAFRGTLYPINAAVTPGHAVAIGRYPEDIYYMGNPWYLCTFAAAEQLYDAVYTWEQMGSIQVTSVSLPFFKQFMSSAAVGTYHWNSASYKTMMSAIKSYADGFLLIEEEYIPSNHSISEQFNRTTGYPTSAWELTWSFASSLTAFNRRAGVVPGSWGASALTVPTTCLPGNIPRVPITFLETVNTTSDEGVYIAGNLEEIGNWNAQFAVPLTKVSSTVWEVTIMLPASNTWLYKYIQKYTNGTIMWESDPNRSTVSGTGPETISDTWR